MNFIFPRRKMVPFRSATFFLKSDRSKISGFTILELMVATVILLIIIAVLLQLTTGIGSIWKSGTGKVSAFQSARSAFTAVDRVLAGAILNTYNDYVDASGSYRTANNTSTFSPSKFLRASELHFLSGSASQLVSDGSATLNPGHAVFFQAPLGEADAASLGGLRRTLNSTGFYIQYGDPDSSILPAWLQPLFTSNKRFRLVQITEPADSLQIYKSTATPNYDTNWLNFKDTNNNKPRLRILAEDISLLVMRPRLSPKDEEAVATTLSSNFNANTMGSILSPNYQYDSRAWETGYAGQITPAARKELMRNQTPPIMDVAMVALDRRSLARLTFSADPPAALQVPPSLFQNSANLEADLATYAQQLTTAGIRFRIFRTSIELHGAKWSNN